MKQLAIGCCALAALVPTAFGCVAGPKNDVVFDDSTDSFILIGWSGHKSSRVCLYANDDPTGTFTRVNAANAISSSSASTSTDGVKGYFYSDTSVVVPGAQWDCTTGTKAETFVKVEEKDGDNDSTSCNWTFGGSGQDVLNWTYDDGTNLSRCYGDVGGVIGMPNACGSSDRPVIRIEANYKLECHPNYCTSSAQCTSNNECRTGSCVNDLCTFQNVTNFTSCSAGPGYVCYNGNCIDYCTINAQCDTGNQCTTSSCVNNACTSEANVPNGTPCSAGPNYECSGGICSPPGGCVETEGTMCGSGRPIQCQVGFQVNKVWKCVGSNDTCVFPDEGQPGSYCSGPDNGPRQGCGRGAYEDGWPYLTPCTIGGTARCMPTKKCLSGLDPQVGAACAPVPACGPTPDCWLVDQAANVCTSDDI